MSRKVFAGPRRPEVRADWSGRGPAFRAATVPDHFVGSATSRWLMLIVALVVAGCASGPGGPRASAPAAGATAAAPAAGQPTLAPLPDKVTIAYSSISGDFLP